MKTAAQLEKSYRAAQRKAGVELVITNVDGLSSGEIAEITEYCELHQISFSEYIGEALRRKLDDRAMRLAARKAVAA